MACCSEKEVEANPILERIRTRSQWRARFSSKGEEEMAIGSSPTLAIDLTCSLADHAEELKMYEMEKVVALEAEVRKWQELMRTQAYSLQNVVAKLQIELKEAKCRFEAMESERDVCIQKLEEQVRFWKGVMIGNNRASQNTIFVFE